MRAEIVNASSDLRWRNRSCEGAPMLVIDGCVQPIASLWLIHLWLNKKRDTARTYAEQTKLWWRHLGRLKRSWWTAESDDLIEFRHLLSERGLATSSINVATAAIISFYDWAFSKGLIVALPFKSASRLTSPSLTGMVIRPLRVHKQAFRVHSHAEFDGILAASGRVSPGLLLRDELIGEVGRRLGLRAREAAGLRVHPFSSVTDDREIHLFPLDATTTKGGKPRAVLVSRNLMRKIISYIAVSRTHLIARRRKRDSDFVDHGILFVKADGDPILRSYISSMWSALGRRADIPARYHDNRHAMATNVSRRCVAAGEHPYALPGDILGHADNATTQAYIDWLDEEERETYAKSILPYVTSDEGKE